MSGTHLLRANMQPGLLNTSASKINFLNTVPLHDMHAGRAVLQTQTNTHVQGSTQMAVPVQPVS
jgi:hypothetical protein